MHFFMSKGDKEKHAGEDCLVPIVMVLVRGHWVKKTRYIVGISSTSRIS